MSDDSPFPPDKRLHPHPNSLAALKPIQKGERRNPTGKNGRERSDHIVNFLERADSTELGRKLIQKLGMPADTPRIDAILQAEIIAGLIPSKGGPSRKSLYEQYGGKPKMQMDLSNSDGTLSNQRVVAYLPDNGRGPRVEELSQSLEKIASEAEPPDDDGSSST